ncbi:hypothetical protein PLESTM_000938200 [Pleodorina starrii]|nr:hypothetical protein PLESTM_000938200 [Pleodorina starrii]
MYTPAAGTPAVGHNIQTLTASPSWCWTCALGVKARLGEENLACNKLVRGVSTEGASVMTGIHRGVATQEVHCYLSLSTKRVSELEDAATEVGTEGTASSGSARGSRRSRSWPNMYMALLRLYFEQEMGLYNTPHDTRLYIDRDAHADVSPRLGP